MEYVGMNLYACIRMNHTHFRDVFWSVIHIRYLKLVDVNTTTWEVGWLDKCIMEKPNNDLGRFDLNFT